MDDNVCLINEIDNEKKDIKTLNKFNISNKKSGIKSRLIL